VVVDDSIVRGTTSKKNHKDDFVRLGAKEVHMRISSPPTIGPCFYGIDTPTRQELIASTHLVEEIPEIYYSRQPILPLGISGLRGIVPHPEDYCTACFDNKYPILFPREKSAPDGIVFRVITYIKNRHL